MATVSETEADKPTDSKETTNSIEEKKENDSSNNSNDSKSKTEFTKSVTIAEVIFHWSVFLPFSEHISF